MSAEIRTLADGEKITEPGFYSISLDQHHSQPCDGPSVTSGGLRKLFLESPADVWAFSRLNPNRYPQPDSTALRLGRAMAAFVEGGMDAVAQEYLVLPKDKPSRPTEAQMDNYHKRGAGDLSKFMVLPDARPRRPTEKQIADVAAGKGTAAATNSVDFWARVDADGREGLSQSEANSLVALKKKVGFWANIEADGRTPLTDAEITMIEDMGEVLAADPAASIIMGGLPEVTMAYRDQITGLWVLARPDTINFDGSVTDYKKMTAQGRPFNHSIVDRRITQHGYDMQLALGAEAFENLTGEWPEIAGIIAQSDKPPHHVILREIDQNDLRIGQKSNRIALDRFAKCLEENHWPGPADDSGVYIRPEWQREYLLELFQTEGLTQ